MRQELSSLSFRSTQQRCALSFPPLSMNFFSPSFSSSPPPGNGKPSFERQETWSSDRALDVASPRSRRGDRKRLGAEGERHERRAPREKKGAEEKEKQKSIELSTFLFFSFWCCSPSCFRLHSGPYLGDALGSHRRREKRGGKKEGDKGKKEKKSWSFLFSVFLFFFFFREVVVKSDLSLFLFFHHVFSLSLPFHVYTFLRSPSPPPPCLDSL